MALEVELCLIGTANAENLGGVARLCDNFGVAALTLVAPRVAVDDSRAQVVGRMARERLLATRVTADLDAAVRECVHVVGFSARRGAARPTVALSGLAAHLAARAPAGRVALVFGPEDAGLSAADIDRCDVVACIETPGPLPSLNLTQAVAIALWELGRSGWRAEAAPARGGATRADIDAFVDHALQALDAIDYGRADERARTRVHLRRLVAGAALGADELRSLHGMCAQVIRQTAR